jgi:hypothetical protein
MIPEIVTYKVPVIAAVTVLGAALEEIGFSNRQTIVLVIGQIIVAVITGYCLVKVAQLKTHIKSRMDDLLKLTKEASMAAGVIEGVRKERAEVALTAKASADAKKNQ